MMMSALATKTFNFQTRMAKGIFKMCEFVETIFSTIQLIKLRTDGDWHIRWDNA